MVDPRRPRGREARPAALALLIIAAVFIGTGVWQLMSFGDALRSSGRRSLLQLARLAAQVAADDPSGLDEVLVAEDDGIHIVDPSGREAGRSASWGGTRVLSDAASGRTGAGLYEVPGRPDERAVGFSPIEGTRSVVIVERPADVLDPSPAFPLVRLVLSSTLIVGLIALIARLLGQLSRSRNELSAILESIAEGAVIVDPEGRVLDMNPAMERLGGWTTEEIKGLRIFEVFTLEDSNGAVIPPERRPLIRALQRQWVVTSRGYDIILVGREGRRVPVNIATAPVFGPGGELIGAVGIVRDVSYEREIDELKSTLISTVSHELRTPLTVIRGYSELLLSRRLSEASAISAVEAIRDSSARLGRLIEDLLSVSRIEAGEVRTRSGPVDLRAVVEQTVAQFEPLGRSIEVDLGTGCDMVWADHDQFIQVLENLISNAVKYSSGSNPVVVRATKIDDHVRVSVADLGIGMSEEDQRSLFTKFFRADRPEVRDVGGTGLGLYIARNLVELQGGKMWVRSTEGAGSTFFFTVPSAPAAAVGAEDTSEEAVS